jgi:hypothetical protein
MMTEVIEAVEKGFREYKTGRCARNDRMRKGFYSGMLPLCQFMGVLFAPSFLALTHHVTNRFLQAVEGQFKHGKDLLDVTNSAGIRPFL